MPETPHHPHSNALSLSPMEQWTLHHVLLKRITQDATATEPTQIDPPPPELLTSFKTLDAGNTSFTLAQLNAIQSLLAKSHHSRTWDHDRARIEQLLHHVTNQLN